VAGKVACRSEGRRDQAETHPGIPQPSRSAELNPVENIWQFLRANDLPNRVFASRGGIINDACDASTMLIAAPPTTTFTGMRKWACIRPKMRSVGIASISTLRNQGERERQTFAIGLS
jgi:hypothetical protein